MIIFIFWLLSLFVVYLSNVISDRIIYSREKKSLHQESFAKQVKPQENLSSTPKENFVASLENKDKNIDRDRQKEDAYAYHFIPTIPRKPEPKPAFAPQQSIESNLYPSQPNVSSDMSLFDLSAFIPNQERKGTISYPNIPIDGANPINLKQSINSNIVSSLPLQDKDFYTLNDYRIFNKILKDIQEHNHSNSLVIDKDLEYRLITKYSTETYNLFKKMLKNYSN